MLRKQRIWLLAFLLVIILVSRIHAAAQAPLTQGPADLVYLKVETMTPSSFDETPDWAPPHDTRATIDGDLLTRWASNYSDNQWISFDFGAPKTVNKIVIFWETAYAADYDILVSLDYKNWQPLLSLKGQDGGIDEIDFTPVKARFVKILGTRRFNPDWGISVWETVFLGPQRYNSADKPLKEVYPQLAKQLSAKESVLLIQEAEKPVSSPGPLTAAEFQKGVVYTSWGKAELLTPLSDRTLEYLSKLGVRNLGIMVIWVQDTNDEKIIYPDPKDTPEDRALIHAINKAHSLGMKVMLKPHVDIKTGQWRGDIIASKEWFKSYRDYLVYYAKLAAQHNVELFSVGTELINTTTPAWQKEWEEIIKETRNVFPGPLVYGANWDEYKTVSFWDKVDFLGIDAYFPLTTKKDPVKEELVSAWKAHAAEIDNWLRDNKINKPVIFAEVGYCSADGTNIKPWSVLSGLSEKFIDQQEQADALDAMLEVCSGYRWFKGLYWWNYFPQERWSPLGYTIQGKKAEEVFSEWLNKL